MAIPCIHWDVDLKNRKKNGKRSKKKKVGDFYLSCRRTTKRSIMKQLLDERMNGQLISFTTAQKEGFKANRKAKKNIIPEQIRELCNLIGLLSVDDNDNVLKAFSIYRRDFNL